MFAKLAQPNRDRRPNERGFTIIELMIATAVLSTIILLVTVLMINVSNLYYKGINQSRAQDNARSIVDDVASHLQLSDHSPSGPVSQTYPQHDVNATTIYAYCIDNIRYSFATGIQMGSTVGDYTLQHILWRDTISSGAGCVPADLTQSNPSATTGGSNGAELVAAKSRLSTFSINPVTSPYVVTVGVAYGDDDLLNNPASTNPLCKGGTGDQFCATARLQVTVTKRLTDNSL
ncbi:MAG TPA: prepilin-type N-terminal cleavage/methylation domain-containing protein [Candidatus Saccharimonadales bacterium]|nr:prepilin-type N-terminal cleavage/methylation domain-containing protein [Candidatus Saccharimonadales bacterium]